MSNNVDVAMPGECKVASKEREKIDHFTVVCFVAYSLNKFEAGVDLVLIETSLLFLC